MRLNRSEVSALEAEYFDNVYVEEEFGAPTWTYDALLDAESALMAAGVQFGRGYRRLDLPSRLILAAEAVNWAAKVINYGFYSLKPRLVAAAANAGAFIWDAQDEGGNDVVYVYTPSVGTASFHDPDGECWDEGLTLSSRHNCRKFPWSGIGRQWLAFDLLVNDQLRTELAVLTRPRQHPELAQVRDYPAYAAALVADMATGWW